MKKKKLKSIIIKSISVVLIIASLAFILYYLGNLFFSKDEIFKEFQKWGSENFYLAVFLFLILSPLINLLPGISSMFFIALGNSLFNDQTILGMIRTSIICSISVVLTSSLMFIIGRFGGKKLIDWIVGKDELDKAKEYLTIGGKACLPMIYLLPFFPDDTMSLVAGMTDMSFMYNFISALIFRSVGVITLTFLGTDFFDYKSFTYIQWIEFILLVIAVFSIVIYLTYLYYKYLLHKKLGRKFYLIYHLKIKKVKRRE